MRQSETGQYIKKYTLRANTIKGTLKTNYEVLDMFLAEVKTSSIPN